MELWTRRGDPYSPLPTRYKSQVAQHKYLDSVTGSSTTVVKAKVRLPRRGGSAPRAEAAERWRRGDGQHPTERTQRGPKGDGRHAKTRSWSVIEGAVIIAGHRPPVILGFPLSSLRSFRIIGSQIVPDRNEKLAGSKSKMPAAERSAATRIRTV